MRRRVSISKKEKRGGCVYVCLSAGEEGRGRLDGGMRDRERNWF